MPIEFNDDKRCIECGQTHGITTAGICLRCVGQILRGKPVHSEMGQLVAKHINAALKANTR
jgi:hypothetical protein